MKIHYKYFIFIIIHLLQSSFIKAEEGYAIFFPQESTVYLYSDNKNHLIIDSLANDSINEIYYCVEIIKSRHKRAYIETFVMDNESVIHKGWIDWKHLGIRTINGHITLRAKNNKNAKVVIEFEDLGWERLLHIRKARKKWIYVYDCEKDYLIKGWIDPELQCVNSYTTCN